MRFAARVIEQVMPMIGPEGQRDAARRFRCEQRAQNGDHIAVAPQMRALFKRTIRVFDHIAQMGKVDARAKFLHHCRQIIQRVGPQRVGAEGQPVFRRIHGIQHPADIIGIGNDARQPENIARRIIGMNTKIEPEFLRGGNDLLQETLVIGAQIVAAQALIGVERAAQCFKAVAVIGTGQP